MKRLSHVIQRSLLFIYAYAIACPLNGVISVHYFFNKRKDTKNFCYDETGYNYVLHFIKQYAFDLVCERTD